MSTLTRNEFQKKITFLFDNVGHLNPASRHIVDDIFEELKRVQSINLAFHEWDFWIQYKDEFYLFSAFESNGNHHIILDHELIIREYAEESPENQSEDALDETTFLQELKKAIVKSIVHAELGDYYNWIHNNLPLQNRTGILDFADLSEDTKKLIPVVEPNLPQEEVDKFLACKEDGYTISAQIRFRKMNASVYYNMYATALRSCNYEGINDLVKPLSDKEIFFKYCAQGYDGYLKEVNDDDPGEFAQWYNKVCRGGNVYFSYKNNKTLPTSLILCQDEIGYFLILHSRLPEGNPQVVQFYNALTEKNYPVWIQHPEELIDWLSGKECKVGIYPQETLDKNSIIQKDNYLAGIMAFDDLPNKEAKSEVRWYRERDLTPATEE